MGVYSKIVSVPKQIDTIHTFIGGTRTDITSGWTFVNGVRKQVFPSDEYYTEVYSKTTGGSYSESLSYGRYKIVISGGGGSGGACIREVNAGTLDFNQNGFAGEEKTIYIDVPFGETKTASGTVGSGASGATVSIASGNGGTVSSAYGAVGTGYQNGATANPKYAVTRTGVQATQSWGLVGGSGGGSTSLLIDSELNAVAVGGNGGTNRINDSGWRYSNGGAGGSGGTTSGTGAAGGASAYWIGYNNHGAHTATSGAGASGYVRIYKSSIYPA